MGRAWGSQGLEQGLVRVARRTELALGKDGDRPGVDDFGRHGAGLDLIRLLEHDLLLHLQRHLVEAGDSRLLLGVEGCAIGLFDHLERDNDEHTKKKGQPKKKKKNIHAESPC